MIFNHSKTVTTTQNDTKFYSRNRGAVFDLDRQMAVKEHSIAQVHNINYS